MATVGGLLGGLWQVLPRATARRRALQFMRSHTKGISSEKQTAPHQLPSIQPRGVKKGDFRLFENVGEMITSINRQSLVQCKEPVRVVASDIECLCSWNLASGPRQAITVPGECSYRNSSTGKHIPANEANRKIQGDASRPRTASLPITGHTSNDSLDPPVSKSSFRVFNSRVIPRGLTWGDPLASLFAMKPNLKLDNVDVMVHGGILVQLLAIASWQPRKILGSRTRFCGLAVDLSLINNTLVIQKRTRLNAAASPTPPNWNHYEAATVPVPGVQDSSHHYQFLRYNIGPLSCAVRTKVHGTVQKLPTTKEPSEPHKRRHVNGIDVITAGQGVLTPAAFQANARLQETDPRARWQRESAYLRRRVPYLWTCGQTKLGIAEIIPPGQDAGAGGLTVVEMGDLVREFEEEKNDDLRRLAGLLEWIRDTLRAHGAPCIAVFQVDTSDPSCDRANYTIQIHSAGPEEVLVLLDWHKKHFWSKEDVQQEQVGPRERAFNEDSPPQKGVIRQLARWVGL